MGLRKTVPRKGTETVIAEYHFARVYELRKTVPRKGTETNDLTVLNLKNY